MVRWTLGALMVMKFEAEKDGVRGEKATLGRADGGSGGELMIQAIGVAM
jgi:hypothetical protein